MLLICVKYLQNCDDVIKNTRNIIKKQTASGLSKVA